MTSLRRRSGAALFLWLAAFPAGLAAQQPAPAELSLESALAAARENNPDLLAQRNDQRSARAATRAARADFLPSLSVSGGVGYTAPGEQRFGSVQLSQSSPEYYSSNYQLGVSYFLSGAKLLQPATARAQERATIQRVAGYEANLVSQVAQQYLAVLQAEDQASQAERELARTLEHERLAQARLEVGAGTRLDVRRAEVEKGQAEVTLVQRRNDYQTALLRLGLLMGTELADGTRLTSQFQLFEPRWSADSLVAVAMANNPNLRAARASVGAARTGVRAARSQYLPTLSFSAGVTGSVYSAGNIEPLVQQQLQAYGSQYAACQAQNQMLSALNLPLANCAVVDPGAASVQAAVRKEVAAANPNFPFDFTRQPFGASLTLSLPIFNGLQRERQIEEARVAAQDADLAVRTQELQLRTDIRAAVFTLQAAYRTAQLQEQVARIAAEELRLEQERFRYGAASSVEVTDAQTSLAQAEQARIDAVYNYHKSLAALEALVGQPLR